MVAAGSQDSFHGLVTEEVVAALVLVDWDTSRVPEAFHTESIHRTWEKAEEVAAWMERIGAVDAVAMDIVAADDAWEVPVVEAVSHYRPVVGAVYIGVVAWLEGREAAVGD